MKIIIAAMIIGLAAFPVYAWHGYDVDEGEHIEVSEGQTPQEGDEVEVYHFDTGEYRNEEVQSVSNDELQTYDFENNKYQIYDME